MSNEKPSTELVEMRVNDMDIKKLKTHPSNNIFKFLCLFFDC